MDGAGDSALTFVSKQGSDLIELRQIFGAQWFPKAIDAELGLTGPTHM